MCEFHWLSTANAQPLQGRIMKDYHLKGFISDVVDFSFHSILIKISCNRRNEKYILKPNA